MVDRVPNRQWLPFAISFLRAYDNVAVMRELSDRLVIPSGLALIWWNVRTNFVSSAKVKRRLQALKHALQTEVLLLGRQRSRPQEAVAFN